MLTQCRVNAGLMKTRAVKTNCSSAAVKALSVMVSSDSYRVCEVNRGGPGWDRTSDLPRVKRTLFH
jgi:hypothetical protein